MSQFRTEIVSGLDNPEIKLTLAKPRTAPPTMPDRPMLGVVCGSRGSGKSSAVVNLVRMYGSHGFFDHVILVSPTYKNDPKMGLIVNDDRFYEPEVHDDVNAELVDNIIADIKARVEEYKEFEVYAKVYMKLAHARDPAEWLRKADPEDVALLESRDFAPPDFSRFPRGLPSTLVIFDDCVSYASVYRNPRLDRFLLQHRHFNTSVLFCCQVWRGGLPKGIRNNLSLMLLFRNKSMIVKKEIADELASFISGDRFIALWDDACREPHDFLMINADSRTHRFRRNYNEIYVNAEGDDE